MKLRKTTKGEEVYKYLLSMNNKPGVTQVMIAKATKLTRSTVSIHLDYLIAGGKVLFNNKYKSYKVISKLVSDSIFPYNEYRAMSTRTGGPTIALVKDLITKIVKAVDIWRDISFYNDCLQYEYLQATGSNSGILMNEQIQASSYYDIVDRNEYPPICLVDCLAKIIVHIVKTNSKEIDYRLNSMLYHAAITMGCDEILIIHITSFRNSPIDYEYFEVVDDLHNDNPSENPKRKILLRRKQK